MHTLMRKSLTGTQRSGAGVSEAQHCEVTKREALTPGSAFGRVASRSAVMGGMAASPLYARPGPPAGPNTDSSSFQKSKILKKSEFANSSKLKRSFVMRGAAFRMASGIAARTSAARIGLPSSAALTPVCVCTATHRTDLIQTIMEGAFCTDEQGVQKEGGCARQIQPQ